jgi:hypothetical protein
MDLDICNLGTITEGILKEIFRILVNCHKEFSQKCLDRCLPKHRVLIELDDLGGGGGVKKQPQRRVNPPPWNWTHDGHVTQRTALTDVLGNPVYLLIQTARKSRVSSVGIATCYGLDDRGSGV